MTIQEKLDNFIVNINDTIINLDGINFTIKAYKVKIAYYIFLFYKKISYINFEIHERNNNGKLEHYGIYCNICKDSYPYENNIIAENLINNNININLEKIFLCSLDFFKYNSEYLSGFSYKFINSENIDMVYEFLNNFSDKNYIVYDNLDELCYCINNISDFEKRYNSESINLEETNFLTIINRETQIKSLEKVL